jgi:hypothetical protein
MLFVARGYFPLLPDLELDMVAFGPHIVVVVERNHAIVHFRVGKKLCQH